MQYRKLILSVFLAVAATPGCAKKSDESAESGAAKNAAAATPAPVAVVANPAAEARSLFKARCTVCHGETGKGDGPGAAALNPKPRDYTNAEWQASVSDEQLRKVIVMGGAAVGKSPIMPGNPDLDAKPEVVGELVKLVRGLKGT